MQTLRWQQQRLQQVTRVRSQQATQQVQLLRQKLETLDPKAVLKRGYAVVKQDNGAIVRSSSDLTPGQNLLIQLNQGQALVQVTQILEISNINS